MASYRFFFSPPSLGQVCYSPFSLTILRSSWSSFCLYFVSLDQHHIEAFGLHSVSIPFLTSHSFQTHLATMHVSTVALTSVFLSLAHGAALQSRAFSGEATFYGGNLHGGTCSFSTYTLPSGIYGTALSDSNWVDAGNCGACVSVTGPAGNSITAMVCNHHSSRELLLNPFPDCRSMPRLRPQSS
jgi:hypothetical protein